MLGLRGCRLGIVIPELVEMQARALGMYIKNIYTHKDIGANCWVLYAWYIYFYSGSSYD